MKSQKVNKVDGYEGTGRKLNDEELQLVCGGTTDDGAINRRGIATALPMDESCSDCEPDRDGVVPVWVP